MAPKRPKVEPIGNPTLFPMEKLEGASKLANSPRVESPYFEPGMYIGTSAFTAAGSWEMKEEFELITADFTYVRWLGDRKGIEEVTKTWNKTVVDRRDDITNWVELFRKFVARNLKIFAYANNHYAGHGPATVKLFMDL